MTPWLQATFASLRVPGYRVLWFGVLLNFAALWASIVSRGFLAFDLTGSATALGALFLGFGLPMLVATPFGGVLADRLPRKAVVVASQWFFAVNTAVVAVLIIAGVIEIWMLFVASLVEGTGVALAIPARMALVGDLVDDDDVGNAVALQQVSFNAVRVVAPTIAGTLIAVELIGVGGTFALQAVVYAASALVMMRLPDPAVRERQRPASALAEIAEGVRYVRRRPALLVLVVVAYALELTAFTYGVFIPAVVSDVFDRGSVELGVLTTAIAVGAFAASLWVARVADSEGAWRLHMVSSVLFGVCLVAFALAPVYVAALVVGVALGATETGFLALNQSLAMRISHRDYYGRVQAVLLFGFALNGLVGLPAGILADAIGIREALLVLGVVATVLVLAAALFAARTGARDDARPPREERPDAGRVAAS